jgi:beta-lactamase class A
MTMIQEPWGSLPTEGGGLPTARERRAMGEAIPFGAMRHGGRSTMSRRQSLLAGAAAAAGAIGLAPRVAGQAATPTADQDELSQEIITTFGRLPGQQALKLWAPADGGRPPWMVEVNADRQLFIASTFKAYVLAEYLRSAEEAVDPQGDVAIADQLAAQMARKLVLDESIFCLGSPVFNPPDLSGLVSTRTTLEAMISRSDNTATDMILKEVGHQRVQAFVDAIGLRATPIPASLRQLIAYDAGFAEWQTITWDQLTSDSTGSPHPILNDVIAMASTPDDLVSFFSRALRGEFFRFGETLDVFRAILATADAIAAIMPLGVSAFGKGGNFDVHQEHALSFAGGMYVPDRWVYFSLIINWTDAEAGPASEVQAPFVAAGRTIFTLVRDRLQT